MSSDTKPVFLLIHGAWHNASTWDGVRAELKAAGYETYAQTNVSVGQRDPPVTSHLEDSAPVREAIKEITGKRHRNVILVAHSYGGIIMGDSVKGLERKAGEREYGVIGCVYVTAFMVPTGESLRSFGVKWKELSGHADAGISLDALEFNNRTPPTYYMVHNTHHFFYHDVPKEESDEWTAKLDWQATGTSASNSESDAWTLVPCMYIRCTEDEAIHIEQQLWMVEQASKNSKYPIEQREIVRSHSPWLRHTPELVRYLREAAGEHF